MKLTIIRIVLFVFLGIQMPVIALASDAHQGHGKSDNMSHQTPAGTFEHKSTADGVQTEFQIMSLASMNMKDPNGATHHIMVKFVDPNTNQPIKNAVGKVKVINPGGKEQIQTLKNYSGVLAANFSFPEKGKYGVICLFKIDNQKRVVKFWYPHS